MKRPRKHDACRAGEPGSAETRCERLLAELERERLRAAEAAAQHERRARELSAALESTHAMLALLDRDLRFRMVNSAYERECGYTKEELLGRPHFLFFPHEENRRIFERVRDTGEPYHTVEKAFEYRDRPERGVTFWNWSLVPIKDEEGEVESLLLSLFEVTPLVLARQRMERLAQQMDAVFAAMIDGVLIYSGEGVVLQANPAARRTHGFDPAGLSYAELSLRADMRLGDGQPLDPEQMPAARALRGEVVVNQRLELVAADGQRRIMLVSCAPLYSDGKVTGAVAVWRDATEREELLAGAQAARAEAEHAYAMRERFMAILSHDLRNPLAAITMVAEILSRREGLDPAARGAVQRIRTYADRMVAMIRDLLDYTRTHAGRIPLAREPTDLGRLAAEIVDEVRASNPGREVVLRAAGDGSGVWDPERIKQVIANLVTNAIQYGLERAPVEVAIEARDGHVELTVHNQGPPIPEEAQSTLFEPFQRGPAGRPCRGLGLGLYIVREIVQAHGGGVTVRSSEAEGTRFTVTLPRRSDDGLLDRPR